MLRQGCTSCDRTSMRIWVNVELKHLSKETYEGFSETQEICQISLENPSLCFSHLIQELAYNYTLFSRMSAQAPTKVFSTGNYSWTNRRLLSKRASFNTKKKWNGKNTMLLYSEIEKKYSINKRRKDNILSKQQGKPAINSTTYFQRTHNDKTQGECNIFVFSCKLAVLRGLNIEYRIELQYSPKL